MGEFVAFEAAISLLKETGQEHVIHDVFESCKASLTQNKEDVINHVKAIYAPFSAQQISDRIAKIITPKEVKAEVQVIYQTLENLHVVTGISRETIQHREAIKL
jgi:amidophosphoribosyltransferase